MSKKKIEIVRGITCRCGIHSLENIEDNIVLFVGRKLTKENILNSLSSVKEDASLNDTVKRELSEIVDAEQLDKYRVGLMIFILSSYKRALSFVEFAKTDVDDERGGCPVIRSIVVDHTNANKVIEPSKFKYEYCDTATELFGQLKTCQRHEVFHVENLDPMRICDPLLNSEDFFYNRAACKIAQMYLEILISANRLSIDLNELTAMVFKLDGYEHELIFSRLNAQVRSGVKPPERIRVFKITERKQYDEVMRVRMLVNMLLDAIQTA